MRLLLIIFLLFSITQTAAARVITSLERWQGRVRISQNLRVEKGGRLIIAPKTQVIIANGIGIEISGELQATDVEFSGHDWSGLLLKGAEIQTKLKNCRIKGARTGITVIGGAPQMIGLFLENNRIGIELRQKSRALVKNSTFLSNSRVGLFVKDEATPDIKNNRFEKQGKFGAYIYRALPWQFAHNLFIDNPIGLMISHFGSNPLITNNDFRHNEIGIKVDRAARPQISANRIEMNQTGLELYRRSDPLIEFNLLNKNQQAIHLSFSSYPRIRHNNFRDNAKALVLAYQSSTWEEQKGAATRRLQISSQGAFGGQKQSQVTEEQRRARNLDGTVDARQNWWGVKETGELETYGPEANLPWIDDGRDRPMFEDGGQSYPLDVVRYHPFAKQPYPTKVSK